VLRRIAKALLWPPRRFFDPRFQGVVDRVDAARDESDKHYVALALLQEQVNHLQALIRADMEATSDAVTLLGRSLREIEASLEAIRRLVEEQDVRASNARHELKTP